MTRQILKVTENGRCFTVSKTDDQYTPYRIYHHTWEMGKYGYYTEHKRQVAKYSDMYSVMKFLTEWVC